MTNAVVYGYNFLPEVGIEQNLGLKQHGGVGFRETLYSDPSKASDMSFRMAQGDGTSVRHEQQKTWTQASNKSNGWTAGC